MNPLPSIRLWPGVVAVALQWLLRYGVPVFFPEALMVAVAGGALGGVAVVVWWLFFSRAPQIDRWGAFALMAASLAATPLILHRSIAAGMMGLMFFIYAIPAVSLAFVAALVLSRNAGRQVRRAVPAAAILLACGLWALVRTNGISGDAGSDFAWRWSKTAEERLLAAAVPLPSAAPAPVAAARMKTEAVAKPAAPVVATPIAAEASWPGFRGPHRDSVVEGVRIKTDWSASPPAELWRRPVGPGWSSFAVRGDRIYTQEQRGEDEVVACYDAATGNPVWAHRDAARFWESNAGAGPRSTPTLHGRRVYTFGATGILNALDADSGAVAWSRNAASDTGVKTPMWGFASSPLVLDGMVIVATAGRLAAYEAATGVPRWMGPEGGGGGYSSPHLLKVDGAAQILLLSGTGATGVAPADGKLIWQHAWPDSGAILQPAVMADGSLLISGGEGAGLRRLAIVNSPAGWTAEAKWTSNGLKPYFNDFAVHDGHAFGFDGSILSCIDTRDGKRKWKGGRYGHGQLVLLRDQGLLLVLSEEGELALVKAGTDQFTELARFPALEGKTWNHPVLAGERLLVRNGTEMAAFRLAVEGR